jgi:hypothetical protein
MRLEPERHFTLAHGLDNPLLSGVLAEQLQRPSHAAFWRRATGQSNDLLLLPLGKAGRGAAPRRVVQGPFEARRTEPFADAADHPLRTADVFNYLLVGEPFIGLKQHQRPSNHAHRTRPRLHQLP